MTYSSRFFFTIRFNSNQNASIFIYFYDTCVCVAQAIKINVIEFSLKAFVIFLFSHQFYYLMFDDFGIDLKSNEID